jgi:hypothetical protein
MVKVNSNYNTRKPEGIDFNEERWEFVGRIADESIRGKYKYKDVSVYVGTQNPIRYLNC